MEIPDLCPALIVVAGLFCRRDFSAALCICLAYLLFLLTFSALNKEVPVGMGDAKLFSALGFCMGMCNTARVFAASSLLSGLFALFLLIKGKEKNYRFPFGPFIALGFFLIAFASGTPSR